MNSAEPRGRDLADKYVVARASDIPDGGRIIVEVAGRSVGVFNVDNEFYAFLNRCPHRGAPLCQGDVVDFVYAAEPGNVAIDGSRKYLACPWHGWEFDLKTGQSWFDPVKTRARPFSVGVESGECVSKRLVEGDAALPEENAAHFVNPVTHRIQGPYRAESLSVQVEGDYVVLLLRPPAAQSSPSAD